MFLESGTAGHSNMVTGVRFPSYELFTHFNEPILFQGRKVTSQVAIGNVE